jgi:FkbM family methyltransferase
MKEKVKQVVKKLIDQSAAFIVNTRVGSYAYNQIIDSAMKKFIEVSHDGLRLKVVTPNSLCEWRAKTFSTKEPETLEWIDSIQKNSILWDVGANIGLYSIFAAKRKNCKVWAFEPSVFNLELLARNIYVNELSKQICIVPVALSDNSGSSQMRMTTTKWGGALSTFGQDFGWNGKAMSQVFEFQIIGLTMQDATQLLKIPQPDYIKIDVDGLEHFILKGGFSVLAKVKQVLIEVNDDFHEQAEQCHSIMIKAGLVLKEKHPIDISTNTGVFQNTYNQKWSRD